MRSTRLSKSKTELHPHCVYLRHVDVDEWTTYFFISSPIVGILHLVVGLSVQNSAARLLFYDDSQLRLNSPGHPGFFGAEIDINNYNHKLALNKALFDYESGLIDDKFGFSEVWNDSLRTLEFNDIDHWLHASGNIKDSFDIDSGFWSEADNISFITDYDLEFGEIN